MAGTLEIPKREKKPQGSLLGTIVRDVQFWIPVAVLVAGLAVLGWIS
jgi:hypothetical protein